MAAEGASAQALEASVILDFNTQLEGRVAQLKVNHTDVSLDFFVTAISIEMFQVSTWFWDSNAAFTLVLDNPTAFGFVDNTSYGNTGDFWG